MQQTNLFGQPEHISEPKKRNHTACGCFTEVADNENHYRHILAYLKRGKSLTVSECYKRFYTAELRTYICQIAKRENIKIESKWHYSADRKIKWKEYWIKHENLQS